MDRCMELRKTLLDSGCSFTAKVTADYGDKLSVFSMGCTADSDGNLKFTVLSPETIAGITGELNAMSGFLTFDDKALAFPLLADGEVSPVSAPWLLMNSLRGGYLYAAGQEGDVLRLTVRDSYAEDALQLDVWLDDRDHPSKAEILWQGRRVLSMEIGDFQIL